MYRYSTDYAARGVDRMALLRRVLGETLRGQRLRQQRTLREVSSAARVSLGYLSEVERGQKEASSELLAAICDALELRLSDVLGEVSEGMRRVEQPVPVRRELSPIRRWPPRRRGAWPAPGRAPATPWPAPGPACWTARCARWLRRAPGVPR